MPSNFRCNGTIQDFLVAQDIPGIEGVVTEHDEDSQGKGNHEV